MSSANGGTPTPMNDGRDWGILAAAAAAAIGLKLLMEGAGYAAWSVGLSAGLLPLMLLATSLRGMRRAGPAMLAGAGVLSLALFAPVLFLDFPRWASKMAGSAIIGSAFLVLLGTGAAARGPRFIIGTSLVAAAGIVFALWT